MRFPPLRHLAAGLGIALASLMLPGCSGGKAPALHQDFSGQKAYEHVAAICAMGPRPAGSEALEKSRVWLEQTLAPWGWELRRQTFEDETPRGKKEFVNLRFRHPGASREGKPLWERPIQGLLLSHYDTKTVDDFVFIGANDPASSMGAVIEMARLFGSRPELAGDMEIVFFDGEEAFVQFDAKDGLYGSRHYVTVLRRWELDVRPRWGVLLDIVGHRGIRISIPADSPSVLSRKLFAAADTLGYKDRFGFYKSALIDDHVPLNGAGVPTIDLIDMNYPQWHTAEDTLERIDAASLHMVGRTATLMVERMLLERGAKSPTP